MYRIAWHECTYAERAAPDFIIDIIIGYLQIHFCARPRIHVQSYSCVVLCTPRMLYNYSQYLLHMKYRLAILAIFRVLSPCGASCYWGYPQQPHLTRDSARWTVASKGTPTVRGYLYPHNEFIAVLMLLGLAWILETLVSEYIQLWLLRQNIVNTRISSLMKIYSPLRLTSIEALGYLLSIFMPLKLGQNFQHHCRLKH